MFRIASFQRIRPFGLRGKERPIPASVSPTPSKIPYGGFSPVGLQTSIRVPPSSAQHGLIGTFLPRQASTRFYCPVTWTCVPSERAERRLRITRPVALGSAAGSIVQPPQRLLWPHPRLCAPPRLMNSSLALLKRQRFPNLLCLSFGMCRLPYPGGFNDFIRLFIHRRCCFHPMRRDSTTALPGRSGPA